MAFQAVKNFYGGSVEVAPPKDNFKFTAQAAIKQGAAIKYRTDGKVNKAVNVDGNVMAIALESAAADTDTIRGAFVVPGIVYKAPWGKKAGTYDLAKTSIHASITIGMMTLEMNDNGDGVDFESDHAAIKGPLTLLSYDDTHAYVVFNNSALNKNTTE